MFSPVTPEDSEPLEGKDFHAFLSLLDKYTQRKIYPQTVHSTYWAIHLSSEDCFPLSIAFQSVETLR